ncbi:MAG: hypothetical protein EA415_08460 [Sphaerobacteraceae bacterium]|nr:MAG: hypothetical protein EA415_08460 [Sphaerobacteraceae bacterium]
MSTSKKKDDQEQKDDSKQQSGTQKKSGNGRKRNQQARAEAADNGNGTSERGVDRIKREEPRELEPNEVFDPISSARLATLRLARNWRYGGNTYGAIHAYERILAKYGGTPAAHAAAEELVAMAGELEREGKFYTALNILNKIEEYYEPRYGDLYDSPRPTRYIPRHRRRRA